MSQRISDLLKNTPQPEDKPVINGYLYDDLQAMVENPVFQNGSNRKVCHFTVIPNTQTAIVSCSGRKIDLTTVQPFRHNAMLTPRSMFYGHIDICPVCGNFLFEKKE